MAKTSGAKLRRSLEETILNGINIAFLELDSAPYPTLTMVMPVWNLSHSHVVPMQYLQTLQKASPWLSIELRSWFTQLAQQAAIRGGMRQIEYSRRLLQIILDQAGLVHVVAVGMEAKEYYRTINELGRRKLGSPYIACFIELRII